MPASSMLPHDRPTKPQSAQSQMCYDCGRVHSGRHAGAHFNVARPQDYHHISDEGLAYTEAEMRELGMAANVSHGWCPECTEKERAHMQAGNDSRKALREAREAAERETRSAQDNIPAAHQPILDAYRPVPEAREPIPEAHTPIPGAREPVEIPDSDRQE